MKVICEKCNTKQIEAEQFCLNCGGQLGGFANNKFLFILMGVVALFFPFMVATSKTNKFTDILHPTLFFCFYLPMLAVCLCLYDYHPTRITIYFYGTAMVCSFYLLVYFW